ncbi:MAG TPA: TonB-dependent receptor [Steroidobacteraceae bacterium]|nr:TonB-dependent receptor [Steroidobacteraceae bacterium]
MHPGNRGRLAAAVFFSLASAAATEALAQQQGKGDAGAGLEEVVVTATKRATTVQETPMSLTAITGEDIQERGLPDFAAIVQAVPGVSMRTSGPGQTEVEMRGMTSAGGNSSTVGFYLDDTPLTAPANAQNGKVVIDPNLYDLNRVEVLRGPQGTLYGSGSMGGTIKLVPNPPNPAGFDASAELTPSYTDGGGFNRGENAMINLPFGGGTAALRVVGSESHDSGWIDRIVIANGQFPLETVDAQGNLTKRGDVRAAPVAADYRNVNDAEREAVRASLLWKPLEQLSVAPSLLYQRIAQGGLNQIDSDPGTDAHYQPFDTPESYSDRITIGSLNVQYDFSAFNVTSTTSRWVRKTSLHQDGSEEFQYAFSTPTAIMPFYTAAGGLGATAPTPVENDSSSQTSEEIRLTSTGDTAFKWLVGFFYQRFESCYCEQVLLPGGEALFGTQNAFTQEQTTHIDQTALFTELSYQLTRQLKATAGVRRYSYRSRVDTSVSGFVSATGSDAVASSSSPENNQGVNPKFDLSYAVDRNLLVYGTIAKGFRPGGGNQPIPTSGPLGDTCEANLQANHGTSSFVPAPNSFGPDTVWSYELGEKLRTFANRVTINSAIYFEKWNGTQQNVPLPCGYPYTANAGVAHIYGAEIELSALLLPGLTFNANGGYTHATFVVGSLEAGILPGTRVQDIPEHTLSTALVYRHPLTGALSLATHLENDYVGRRTDVTYAVNDLPSYDLTNVRAGIESDHWTAMLFARNVFNERAILTNAFQINLNVPTFNRAVLTQPVTFGLDLSYRF